MVMTKINAFRGEKQKITSRERPKSALYLRLKIVKKRDPFVSQCQKKYERGGTLWNFLTCKKKGPFRVTVPKKYERGGTLWNFLTSLVLQDIGTNEGETLWWNPKKFKKVALCRKKSE